MRKVIIMLCVAVVLLVAAAHIYRDPRVQELFRSAPQKSRIEKNIRGKDESTVTSGQRSGAILKKGIPTTRSSEEQKQQARALPGSQTPDDVVSRVLLRVLAAKGLSSGISLSVSGTTIRIFGEVDSTEKRQEILKVIEKGRESREIDASGLVVR